MLRRLLTLCSAVSLLLCTAVCVLWALTLWPMPPTFTIVEGNFRTPGPSFDISPEGFKLEVRVARPTEQGPAATEEGVAAWRAAYQKDHRELKWGGLYAWWRWPIIIQYSQPSYRYEFIGYSGGVDIPYWLAFALTFACSAPALLAIAHRRRAMARARRGQCATCGYDLRATPDRCPECGTSNARAA